MLKLLEDLINFILKTNLILIGKKIDMRLITYRVDIDYKYRKFSASVDFEYYHKYLSTNAIDLLG